MNKLKDEVKEAVLAAVGARPRSFDAMAELEAGRLDTFPSGAALKAALAVLDGYEEIEVSEQHGTMSHFLELPADHRYGNGSGKLATIYMKKQEPETLTVDRGAYARLIEEAESPTPSREHEVVLTQARKALD